MTPHPGRRRARQPGPRTRHPHNFTGHRGGQATGRDKHQRDPIRGMYTR